MKPLSLRLALTLVMGVLLTGCGQAQPEQTEEPESTVIESEEELPNVAFPEESIEEPELNVIEVGSTIFFGSYPQTNENSEPIEWIVLDSREDRVLLLANDCIESLPWHNTHESITWDYCDLRVWLRDDFLQAAFTTEERETILLSDLDNGDDLGYGTPVGENTQDKVFLLSGAELERYLPTDESRTVKPTEYAVSHGAYTNGSGDCAWWLRSPGMSETSPAYVSSGGSVGSRAHEADETIIGVRPAIWVRKDVLK